PLVRKAGDLTLATSHFAQSSSASRVTAAQAGLFILSRSGERPDDKSNPSASKQRDGLCDHRAHVLFPARTEPLEDSQSGTCTDPGLALGTKPESPVCTED